LLTFGPHKEEAIPSFERKNHVGVFIERKKSLHGLENFGTLVLVVRGYI
jgi:hypothetical protein